MSQPNLRNLRWLVAAVACVLIVGWIVFGRSGSPAMEVPLPDGSVLRFEQIRYGKWEQYKIGGTFEGVREWVRGLWLRKKYGGSIQPLAGQSSGWGSDYAWHPDQNGLQFWITRSYPHPSTAPGMMSRVNVDSIQIVDADGCIFPATQTGGMFQEVVANDIRQAGSIEVNWFNFAAFPRNDRQLKLQIYEYGPQRKLLAEVKIPNPAPTPRQSPIRAESFPISKKSGDLTFVLKGVSTKENWKDFQRGERTFGHPLEIAPDLEVLENGKTVNVSEGFDYELLDASGNFASKMYGNSLWLCPKVEPWTLRLKYFGIDTFDEKLDAVWKLPGIKMASAGAFTLINLTNTLQGVPVTVIDIAGPGNITYSNGISPSASMPAQPIRRNSRGMSIRTGWGTGATDYNLQMTNAHLALVVGKMSHDQRLFVTANDDQGRTYQAYGWDWDWGRAGSHYVYKSQSEEPLLLMLNLSPDAKTLDLTIAIRSARSVEFTFKPLAKDKE